VSDVHDFQVVYLTGSGRSGSTLVERTLGALPDWVNVGELIDLFRTTTVVHERCGCGHAFADCPFWSEVGAIAYGGWSSDVLAELGSLQRQVSRQRHLPQLLAVRPGSSSEMATHCRDYAQHYARICRAVVQVSGAHVIVDASKWPGQALALSRGGVPVRLLHQIRDPRGVAHSWAKSDVARPQSGAGSRMATRGPLATAARWMALQSEIDVISRSFDHATTLRYEDFVAHPPQAVARVVRELGFSPAADDLAHVGAHEIDLPESHGLAGNPSRFQVGTVAVRADEAWRRSLDPAHQRLVTAVTAPLLLRYGYPVRGIGRPAPPAQDTATSLGASPAPGAEIPAPPPGGWPLVAVVLPTRGRPELLREAVDSVLGQDYAGDLEIVVVHDQEQPQLELAELAEPGRSVTLLQNTHAPGLAGARNTGLDHVKADYVASCDDDDFWDRSKLRLQMARMVDEPELGVLGAGIRLLMSQTQVVDWPGDSPDITREQLLRNRRKELHSSTLLVRRSVYDAVGGYDEVLPNSYAEDYEFLLRAVAVAGVGVVNQPLASVRKYNASWFRDRAEVVATALEYLLQEHPEIATSRRGHARVLGQVAFARSTLGQRGAAVRLALRAVSRWPFAPHAVLALVHATTGADPRVLLGSVRRFGRGIT
jgi:glycosyltransferase involved in cell wall biosynthesis